MNLIAATLTLLTISLSNYEANAVCTYYRGSCFYQNQFYFVGEKWKTDNCELCKCKPRGYKCCTTFWTPSEIPEECVALWDQKNCQFNVVLRKDESKECHKEPLVGVL